MQTHRPCLKCPRELLLTLALLLLLSLPLHLVLLPGPGEGWRRALLLSTDSLWRLTRGLLTTCLPEV